MKLQTSGISYNQKKLKSLILLFLFNSAICSCLWFRFFASALHVVADLFWPKTMLVVSLNLLKSSGLPSISLWFDWLSVLLIPALVFLPIAIWKIHANLCFVRVAVSRCWLPWVGCRTGSGMWRSLGCCMSKGIWGRQIWMAIVRVVFWF